MGEIENVTSRIEPHFTQPSNMQGAADVGDGRSVPVLCSVAKVLRNT